MRKLMLVLVLASVLVALAAAAALAAEGQLIQCRNVLPCYGGTGDDRILERIGDGKDDEIVPRGGDDLVLANKYTADTDVVRGGGGFDRINVADGDSVVAIARNAEDSADEDSETDPDGPGEDVPSDTDTDATDLGGGAGGGAAEEE